MTGPRTGGDAARDRLVKELFERALEAPPGERDEILAASRSISLADEVRALLRDEAEIGDFLETSARRLLGADVPEARLAPGETVADFTVVGVLGEGGGGVVYEAEQREPRRRVALKLIRARRRSGDALRAFRDEAANLARLQHAAIAHVYAAGVHEARPWIAMERVEGARSIVRHAREAGLGRDERLRLFVGVCDALHHAHQKGVIHRDVKPGNVLVDAEGRAKVVDFGVACGVEPSGAELAGGRPRDAVGTLAYASPEQLSGDGGVDVRADVFGLGALLYELLTGAVPQDVDALPVDEAARVKREVPVVPPSARADGISPDLDAIVLRALAADRDARYGSAGELAADVRRFLDDEPVAAYAGDTWYQLGKFVRRRRAPAAAIAGIAIALVAGALVSLWFGLENAAARTLAVRRSYAAEIAAAASALRVDDIAEARRRLDRAPPALRDWEWRHLVSRLDGSRSTVPFGERELWGGSISADGSLAAISGVDRSVPDGQRYAALVRADGTVLRAWEAPAADVPCAAISRDGRRFVAGFADGRALVHDVAAGTDRALVPAHAARVIAVAFAPDGTQCVTACADGAARLWSSADGALLRTFAGHGDAVVCAAFDAAGARLVTGCRDGRIRVWDAATGELVRVLTGHEASVEGVSVSPDGARLASVSRDRTVRLWNLADGTIAAVGRSHTSNVRAVAFDPRGGSFVSASWDGTLRVWDARTGAETGLLRGHGSSVSAVDFADGEPRLVSFSWDGTMKRWDAERTDVATCRGLLDQVDSLAFDPGGTRVVAAGHDGSLTLLDARTARATARAEVAGASVRRAVFLDDGSLAVLLDRPELQVWDLAAGGGAPTLARAFPLPAAKYRSVCADRGGAAVWISTTVTCMDARTGAVLETRAPPIPADWIACDGRGGVAVAGRDGGVAFSPSAGVWRTARPAGSAIRSIAFDAAGERIVVACEGGTARVLRTSDLATLLVLEGHSGDAYEAAFLPGGRRIVTVSRDHTVRLWDAADGENVLVLAEHGYPVTCVAVSPDGTRIATAAGTWGDEQTTVKIWEAPAPR